MNTSMMTNEGNELQETRSPLFSPQPAVLKFIAKFISYLFHPVFVPLYVVMFMAYVHPYLFTALGEWNKTRIVMMAALMFTFFPLVTVLLLKGLSFIDSIYLHTKKDRIIPLIACGVWYFWITYIWWNSNKMEDALPIPKEAVQLALATFIASWMGLMANIKIKISLHAIAVGVMMTLFISMALSQDLNFGIWLSGALLVTGLVCTSRFIVSDHTTLEVYGGLAIGVVSVLTAILFIN
ncbi:hypothetical protein CAP36_08170 [Chitinophagaceae bacterium IBVUCB2]|nr:hypothetical protein CAP36_08170 [Chitinophagaceae bacterium IBVUCB2]